MDKIKEIEKLLSEWKADIKPKKHGTNKDRRRFAMGVVSGLESALAILKKQDLGNINTLKDKGDYDSNIKY